MAERSRLRQGYGAARSSLSTRLRQGFCAAGRDTPMLLPVDLRDWIPEGHIVHYILDVVGTLNTSAFETNIRACTELKVEPLVAMKKDNGEL